MPSWRGVSNTFRKAPWRLPFATLMLASVFFADTPQTHLAAVVVAAVSLLALGGLWLRSPAFDKNALTAGIALWLAAIALSFPVAMYFGTTAFDWALRGAAPLSFVAAFFFIRVATPDDVTYVIRVMLACAALWLVLVACDLAAVYPLLSIHRWTAHSGQLLLPWNIVGIAILIFPGRPLRDAIAFPLLLLLLLVTIGAGYRSQFIIAGCLLLCGVAVALLRRDLRRSIAIIAAALLAVAAFAAISRMPADPKAAVPEAQACSVMGDRAMRRGPYNATVEARKGDTGRALEVKFALQRFLESPVLGKGLAYAVPSSLIFFGQEDYLQCLERLHGKKYPHVYYLHNFAAHVAMTMGSLGLVALALIGAGALSSLFSRRIASRDQRLAAIAALASLSAFSLIGASYNLPQFSLLLASLAAILAATKGGEIA